VSDEGAVRALVIENDPTHDIRRLGEWLGEGGLEVEIRRPHLGDPLPATLDAHAALIVLGGDRHAYPDDAGEPGAPWFPTVESLLRKAVRYKVATLGIGLGGQLLAAAHGGVVARSASGPELGAGLVARRDAAESDPIWRYVPFVPDVVQWHYDEIVELPQNAVLLAASTRYPHQAFRLGERAWGTQFHIEADVDAVTGWARANVDLVEADDVDDVVNGAAAVLDDMADVWQAFALRFAAVAKGKLSTSPIRTLPLIGH
jgi:GMP synthase-like glutamine amidotransferase